MVEIKSLNNIGVVCFSFQIIIPNNIAVHLNKANNRKSLEISKLIIQFYVQTLNIDPKKVIQDFYFRLPQI